jgi:caa(3)-type oxidase subunit IV
MAEGEPLRQQISVEGMQDPRETAHARERHPSAKEYIRIALILGVLTLLEIATSYQLSGAVQIVGLFVGMVLKFALVVLWFMHLRFDDRRYARFFLMGLSGAATLYLVVLISFRTFLQ